MGSMKITGWFAAVIAFLLLFLGGCASLEPRPLPDEFWSNTGKRVGIAFTDMPEAELSIQITTTSMFFSPHSHWPFEGISGMDDMNEHPLLLAETRPLRNSLEGYEPRSFTTVADLFVERLALNNFTGVRFDEPIQLKDYPRFKRDGSMYASRDVRSLGQRSGVDYLVVIELRRYGVFCHYLDFYNHYTEAISWVKAEMIDCSTNELLWRARSPVGGVREDASGMCGRTSDIPTILDALDAVLGMSASIIMEDFFRAQPLNENPGVPE